MHRDILPSVIFSPAQLALSLANGLQSRGVDVTLFSPGPIDTTATNHIADLTLFEQELAGRGDSYIDLLKKHPFTFITLARQVQSELISQAYAAANAGRLDIVHIYTNEEDTALPFAALCQKPVVFTHHDPFNFLVRYKSLFPKYPQLNWLSMSYAQRRTMPAGTNWVGNVYHGLSDAALKPATHPAADYVAYLGRLIEPKGAHLAIAAVQAYNRSHPDAPLKLRLAGKHYAGHKKDSYWQDHIEPLIDGKTIEYVGFIDSSTAKQEFLANARAVLVPSLFEEPFGMVSIEALACGTPVIGLDSGAIPEVVEDHKVGRIVQKVHNSDGTVDENATAIALAEAITGMVRIDRAACRQAYETRFTAERMCADHLVIYQQLTQLPDRS
ncbi:MAG TPA: glycosyltransferase [Candidatus Saccharimonadales bacterium]|nr:glycosyltransferase [Candidatus Saccharimonadales bacterium]